MPKQRKRLPRRGRMKRSAKGETHSTLISRAFSGLLDGKRWTVKASKNDKLDIATFRATFAATIWLDMLIGEDEVRWVSDTEIQTSSGVRIEGKDLREIFKYRLKGTEKQFEFDENHHKRVSYIRSDKGYTECCLPDKSRRKSHSRKGMIRIQELCNPLRLKPQDARKFLRSTGLKKPEHGWAWRNHDPQLEQVKSLLKEHAGEEQGSSQKKRSKRR